MFGIDDFFKKILFEAKSPEEVKSILKYQNPNVPEDVINRIVDIDPTKKKNFSRWAVLAWKSESDLVEKSLNDGSLKELFSSGFNLSEIGSLGEALEMMSSYDPILNQENGNGPESDYDIVYDTNEWTIAVPNTWQASVKLGQGCKWCTAGGYGIEKAQHFYEDYTSYGKLWINFDKRNKEKGITTNKVYPYIRYQFLFETENFCNNKNIPIGSFEEIDIPEDVIRFYADINPEYEEVIYTYTDETTKNMQYIEAREHHGFKISEIDNNSLMLLPEYVNDFETISQNFCLYDNEDEIVPIFDSYFDPNDFIVKDFGNGKEYIIKNTDGLLFVVFFSAYWDYYQINDNKYILDGNSIWFCCQDLIVKFDFKNVFSRNNFISYHQRLTLNGISKDESGDTCIKLTMDGKEYTYVYSNDVGFKRLIKPKVNESINKKLKNSIDSLNDRINNL